MNGKEATARTGFTILELLLVLIFVSLLAAVAIPAFFARPSVTLENASVLLARDMRTAQNRSAYLAEECRMEFLPDGSGYRVTDLSGVVVRNPRTGEDFERIYPKDGVFRGVLVKKVVTSDDWTVEFDDRGLPTESAEVTLTFGAEERVVKLDEFHGRVTIFGSSSSWEDDGG